MDKVGEGSGPAAIRRKARVASLRDGADDWLGASRNRLFSFCAGSRHASDRVEGHKGEPWVQEQHSAVAPEGRRVVDV